jgi:hypothetical protein
MKTRNGFVSNSSSSSFVVCLPDEFDINDIDFEKQHSGKMEEDEITKGDVITAFQEFINDKYFFTGDYNSIGMILEEILQPYAIATVECGPDSGALILADNNKIKEILK